MNPGNFYFSMDRFLGKGYMAHSFGDDRDYGGPQSLGAFVDARVGICSLKDSTRHSASRECFGIAEPKTKMEKASPPTSRPLLNHNH